MFRIAQEFKAKSLYFVKHPVVGAGLYFVCLFAGYGIVDYHRDITGVDLSSFKKRSSDHLGEALEYLHSLAYDRDDNMFGNIGLNSERCVETHFLYQKALGKLEEAKTLPMNKEKQLAQLEAQVAKEYYGFTQRMCRRGMIRNGHVIKWLKAVFLDEIFKFYVAPVLGFFVVER